MSRTPFALIRRSKIQILSLPRRPAYVPRVLRIVILGALLHGIEFAQSPQTCTISNATAIGFFGIVDVSGTFTTGAIQNTSIVTVSGVNGVNNYTFTGPLNGPGYTQTSKLPPLCILGPPCPPPGEALLHVGTPNNTMVSLVFEDTGELFTGSGDLSCTALPPPTPLSPTQINTTASGLGYSRVTQTFKGTITITNVGSDPISGPLYPIFDELSVQVTLVNATGYIGGSPYLAVPVTSLAPGQSVTAAVELSNPSHVAVNLTPTVYAGRFF